MTLMSLMATLGMDVSAFRAGAQQAKSDMGALGSASEELAETLKANAKDIQVLSDKFSEFMSGAGTALSAAFTAPLLAIGAAGLKAGVDLDSAFDTIRTKTGQTGAALEGLQGSFRTVFAGVASNAEDTGLAIASIAQRTGQTGPALEAMATQFLNLARITGESLKPAIENTTRLFGDWSIEAGKQAESMDMLFRVTQSTGVGFTSLAEKLVQFGAPLRQLGFSMDEAAVMLGKFEKEGVNVELVLGAMKSALGKFGKAGEEPAEAFARVVEEIKKTDVASGNLIATQLVGIRRAADFAAAIREGRLDFEEMTAAIAAGTDTINRAAGDTDDFAESWQRFKNSMELALEPLGVALIDILNDLTPKLQVIVGVVASVAKSFGDLDPTVQTMIIGIAGVTAAVGPMLLILGKVAGEIPAMKAGLEGLGTSFSGVAKAATLAAGAVAAIELFDALRENAKANDEVTRSTVALDKSIAALKDRLAEHGITVERGTMTAEQYNVALNKAVRDMPGYTAQLAANKKEQEESAAAAKKLKDETDKTGETWIQEQERLKKVAEEHKKLQAAVKASQEHFELFMSKFNGATWDFDQFKQFVREGGNVNSALKEIDTQLVKLRQKFGDDIPPAVRGTIVQLELAKDSLAEFKQQLEEEKLETAFEKLNAELAKTHEKFKGIPPLITEMAKAVADNEIEFEKLGRAVQGVSKPITELPEAIQETVNATARAAAQSGAIWRKLGDDIKDIFRDTFSDLGRGIGSSIWDSIIGNNDNAKLDEQAAQLNASLNERAQDWDRYRGEIEAKIAELQQAHAEELAAEIADLQATLAEKREEYEQYVADTTAKLEAFKQKQDEQLATELASLARNLADRGAEWEAYKAKAESGLAEFTAKQDAEYQKQAQDLLASLAERGQQWADYQRTAIAGLAEFTAKQDEALRQQKASLESDLRERAVAEENYRANALAKLADFRQRQDEKLQEDIASLRRSLAEKQDDYSEYVESVNAKLLDLNETSEQKLQQDLDRLNKSLEDKRQAYNKYVEDVNRRLSRIGEDLEESIDDQTRSTRRGIDDKRRAYEREESDINERIRRELEKGERANQQQIADWKQSLVRKREDLDIYVARAEADLEEYTEDHRRAAQRQTNDLQEQLDQRAKAQYESEQAHIAAVEATTTASRNELTEQTTELQNSLTERTEDWQNYQAGIAQKIATAQSNHDTAIANEEAKVRDSLIERQNQWETYRAGVAEKITAAQTKHDEAIAAEQEKVQQSLSNRQAQWEAYQLEIARKIEAARLKHDEAIAAEYLKVQASLGERQLAWERYQADIAAKVAAAQKKHDDAIAAEELAVFNSLTARAANWERYQRDIDGKIEAARAKHATELANELTDLQDSFDDKREEYDKYAADIKLKLEQIERDHTTVWGRIKDSIVDTMSSAGRAITGTLFEALTDTLFDQLKNSGVWNSISNFLGGIFRSIANTISGLFGSIGSSIAGALGIGGGGSGNSGAVGGAVNTGVGAAASSGGEGGGSTDLLPPVVTAFMQIAGYLQGRRQEQDIARIEVSTRELAEIWKSATGPMHYYATHLPKLSGMETFNYQVVAPGLTGIADEVIAKGLDTVRAVNSMKDVLIQAKDYIHDMVFQIGDGDLNSAIGTGNSLLQQIRDILGDVKISTAATDVNTAAFSTTGIESLLTGLNADLGGKLNTVANNVVNLTSGLGSSLGTALTPVVSALGFVKDAVVNIDPDSMFTQVIGTLETNLKNKWIELDPRPVLTSIQNAFNTWLPQMNSNIITLATSSANRAQPTPSTNNYVYINGVQTISGVSQALASQGVRF